MTNVRKEWLDALLRIVSPVLDSLERGQLKKIYPFPFMRNGRISRPLRLLAEECWDLPPGWRRRVKIWRHRRGPYRKNTGRRL